MHMHLASRQKKAVRILPVCMPKHHAAQEALARVEALSRQEEAARQKASRAAAAANRRAVSACWLSPDALVIGMLSQAARHTVAHFLSVADIHCRTSSCR